MAFVTGFGASGAIAKSFRVSDLLTLFAAIVGGFGIAVIAALIVRHLYRSQSNSSYSSCDLADKTGRVVGEIIPGHYGNVSVSLHGETITKPAKAPNEIEPIKVGSTVKVVSASSTELVVERVIS
ncbi:MAG: NfeD family protein [Candidatus Buchananbacteria bacterium]|nr:NfeD family protein [Candidatus Buchananbacteria bacterium]